MSNQPTTFFTDQIKNPRRVFSPFRDNLAPARSNGKTQLPLFMKWFSLIFLLFFILGPGYPTPSGFISAVIPVTGEAARTDSTAKDDFISLEHFNRQVSGGDPDAIRGVYVAGQLALRVIQQPDGDHGFVSHIQGTVTQFGMAEAHGTIGLLAHNYSSGILFSSLSEGQMVHLSHGDGSVKSYKINRILRFQALQPDSPTSDFIDLETGERLTTPGLFSLVYAGGHRVVLQTCIQQGDEDAWGRLFVMADPV